MIFEIELKTAGNNVLKIQTEDQKAIQHFTDWRNYTKQILQQINSENLYQKWLKDKKDINILDIGGNVGLFSLHVSDVAKQIVTVEPTPSHNHILRELTKNFNNIKPIEAALSNRDGPIQFYMDSWNTTCNSIRAETVSQPTIINVNGKTLKTLLDENNLEEVEFAKIDIEGSEYYALTKETISSTEKRIKSWFIETHPAQNLNRTQVAHHIADIFNDLGYSNIEIFGEHVDQMIVRQS